MGSSVKVGSILKRGAGLRPVQYRLSARTIRADRGELSLFGRLDYRDASSLRVELLGVVDPAGGRGRAPAELELDLSGVEGLDGGAAAVLVDLEERARAHGRRCELVGAEAAAESILRLYRSEPRPGSFCPLPPADTLLEQVGRATQLALDRVRSLLDFVGGGLLALRAFVARPRTLHWRDVGRLAERAGADGLPIVFLITFLLGLITAFQAAVQLQKLGADVYVADLVALSVTRELGPLMTAIVVAGRSGAAYAAELGTMRVSEEVDALRTLGLCPYRFLVFPRVLALAIAVPVLALLGDAFAITGGLVISVTRLDFTPHGYLIAVQDALSLGDVAGGIAKASVFGLIVAFVGCERGLSTRGGAEGVGRSTTSAVVTTLFFLVLADALFAVVYHGLGV